MSKTILLCSNAYPPHIIGGAELVVHYQAKALQTLGCNVAVFAGEGQTAGVHYAVSRDIFDGIPVYRVYLNAQDYSADYVNFFHREVNERFSRVLDEVRPSVIHVHNIIGVSAGIMGIAARRGIRTVVTLHDHWGFCLKNTVIKAGREICRDFSRCAECQPYIADCGDRKLPIRMRNDFLDLQFSKVHAFVSPSQYLAKVYAKAGLPRERLHVIWNGIDVARFSQCLKKPRSGSVRLTYIGYLGEHKGIDTIFDALPLINGYGFELNIVGDGHLRPWLERRAAELGIRSRVRFWGKVKHSEIEEVYRNTDVQILPSIWPENQPVSITEAMASRTAVIASNLGGNPELVIDHETGYLFPAGSPVYLAEKITHFLSDPARIERLGERGYERIREFTFERQARMLLRLYDVPAPAPSGTRGEVPLIACVGERFGPRGLGAVENITRRFGRTAHRFVCCEWLSEDEIKEARIIWALDSVSPAQLQKLMHGQAPILVPGDVPHLREMVLQAGCGLYYENEAEAAECLLWLLEHEAERVELGLNTRNYLAQCAAR